MEINNNMEKELAKKLVSACTEFDVEATIREDYSGRGMYNRTTTGVIIEANNFSIISVVIGCADMFIDKNGEPLFEDCEDINSDNMGNRMIYY